MLSNSCLCPCNCRHTGWCVTDEQYIGTLLSWKVGEDRLDDHVIIDSAMAMVSSGEGFQPHEVDEVLMMEVRGTTSNLTRVPYFLDKHGDCRASER